MKFSEAMTTNVKTTLVQRRLVWQDVSLQTVDKLPAGPTVTLRGAKASEWVIYFEKVYASLTSSAHLRFLKSRMNFKRPGSFSKDRLSSLGAFPKSTPI